MTLLLLHYSGSALTSSVTGLINRWRRRSSRCPAPLISLIFTVYQQRLIFADKQLEDDRLLVSYGNRHESTIHLVLRLRGFDPSVDQGHDGMTDKDGINRKMDVTVFVKITLFGKTTEVHLSNNKFESVTVLQLKEKIQNLEGIPVDQQQLIFAGKQLEDDALLVSYGIRHESTIHVVLRLGGFDLSVYRWHDGMGNKDGINRNVTVFIKELNGRITSIHLPNNEFESVTVLQLKEKIQNLEGIPVHQHRLVFGDCQLEDDRLLVSYGIHHEATIHLIKRLQGGDLPPDDPGRDRMRDKKGKIRKYLWNMLSVNIPSRSLQSQDVTVFIEGLNGRITSIHLPDNKFESVTVLQLKEKIQTVWRYPVDQQRLIFAGRQLEDDRLLVSYGIQHEATIHMVLILGGFDPSVDQGHDGMRNKDGINRKMDVKVFIEDKRPVTPTIQFESSPVQQQNEKLEPLIGVPVEEQRLVSGCDEHEATIHLDARLPKEGAPSSDPRHDGMGKKDGKNRSMEMLVLF
ncbi:uncharacterized protein LOC131990147 [Centropristis striata]|uniref:uncharacterized protein LOC131990147 n=1 Tax=Centropristis striata TaxID=184440 RepID=UPI0027E1F57F|nr:uncharacterized protein LOC131990147 [Centropristis striata]